MRRRTFAGVLGLGLLLTAGTLALLLESDHMEASAFAFAAQLLAAWSFILGGLFAWARRPDNRFGPLLTAVGLAVFVAKTVAVVAHFEAPLRLLLHVEPDPPGACVSAHGLAVGPKAEFSVDDPIANSSQLVLPTITAPAAARRSTTVAS